MGKEEKMLAELLEKVASLEDKLTNMEFLLVQGMGTGGVSTAKLSSPASVSAPQVGSVEVDLTPLEARISQIEGQITNIITKIAELTELTSNLSSEKAQKADELIAQATSLLEKGLQLTELETTMLEFKDRVEEIIIQLEVANVGVTSNDARS
jgi:hypothetical protein